MTDAEREIWHHLRNRALMGHKFRRQYPVGPYIVDFACPARRLVVELDGGQHDEAVDAARTRYLERCGHRILRFWNNDIFERQDTVLAVIFAADRKSVVSGRSVSVGVAPGGSGIFKKKNNQTKTDKK